MDKIESLSGLDTPPLNPSPQILTPLLRSTFNATTPTTLRSDPLLFVSRPVAV